MHILAVCQALLLLPPIRGITCDQHRRSPSPQNPGLTSGSSNEEK